MEQTARNVSAFASSQPFFSRDRVGRTRKRIVNAIHAVGRCVTKADRSPVCCLWGRKSGRPILKSRTGRRPQAGASLSHRSMLAPGMCVQPRACRQLYFCSTAWSRLKLARGLPQLHELACHFKGLCRMQRKAALQIQVAACDSKLNLGLDTALSLHRICCFSRPSLYSTVQRSRLRLDRVRRWRPKAFFGGPCRLRIVSATYHISSHGAG